MKETCACTTPRICFIRTVMNHPLARQTWPDVTCAVTCVVSFAQTSSITHRRSQNKAFLHPLVFRALLRVPVLCKPDIYRGLTFALALCKFLYLHPPDSPFAVRFSHLPSQRFFAAVPSTSPFGASFSYLLLGAFLLQKVSPWL